MTRKNKSKFKIFDLAYFFMLILCLFSLLPMSSATTNVYAAETEYSNVLDDLQKDESFNVYNYPIVVNDYSLHVIQIAESSDELFIYVYLPGATQYASSINISTEIDDNLNYRNYTLSFLNCNGALQKYKVDGLNIKDDAVRYYAISSIFRPFVEGIDEEPDESTGNTIDEVSYSVGQQWTCMTVNNETYYAYTTIETIEIIDKYIGFVRYESGFFLDSNACDSQYVAFSTDKPIDKLVSAKVQYITVPMLNDNIDGDYSDPITVELNYTDVANVSAGSVFIKKYSWDRIQSSDEFINSVDLGDDVENNIKSKDWVLRFAETDFLISPWVGAVLTYWTKVQEVTILQLTFEHDGDTYNLGVIDNKQTGDNDPDNKNWLDDLKDWIIGIISTIAIIFVIAMLAPSVFPLVFKGIVVAVKYIGLGIWYVLKGLWWLIKKPFELFSDS